MIILTILIGIVQGLTEFLPISSTAHMTLFAKFSDYQFIQDPRSWTAFMAIVQLGTLLALLFYFKKEIIEIVSDFLKDNIFKPKKFNTQSLHSKLGWQILVGSIPIFFFGYFLKEIIRGEGTKDIRLIALMLIVIAILMIVSEKVSKFEKDINKITFLDALLIGLAQSLALIPGVSRSGATITAGLFLGLKRESSAKFSFLLSIPAVFVSGVFEFIESYSFFQNENLLPLILGIVSAFISGYFAISFMLLFLKTKTIKPFAYYRILLGLILWALVILK